MELKYYMLQVLVWHHLATTLSFYNVFKRARLFLVKE